MKSLRTTIQESLLSPTWNKSTTVFYGKFKKLEKHMYEFQNFLNELDDSDCSWTDDWISIKSSKLASEARSIYVSPLIDFIADNFKPIEKFYSHNYNYYTLQDDILLAMKGHKYIAIVRPAQELVGVYDVKRKESIYMTRHMGEFFMGGRHREFQDNVLSMALDSGEILVYDVDEQIYDYLAILL